MPSSSDKKLSLGALISLVIGSMVGAGIFTLPSKFGQATGVFGALIAWVIAGTGMLMLAFVFQTLSRRKPDLDAGVYAYAKAGFRVDGICDLDITKAQTLASRFGFDRVYSGVEEAARAAPPNAVFDIAVPPSAVASVLERIPDGRGILIQKPMGETMEQARAIRALCRSKRLIAG